MGIVLQFSSKKQALSTRDSTAWKASSSKVFAVHVFGVLVTLYFASHTQVGLSHVIILQEVLPPALVDNHSIFKDIGTGGYGEGI